MAIAHLAGPVDRQGDHFVCAANRLVKTIRMDWYRPIGRCGGQDGQDPHNRDVKSGRIERTALRTVALHKVRKATESGTGHLAPGPGIEPGRLGRDCWAWCRGAGHDVIGVRCRGRPVGAVGVVSPAAADAGVLREIRGTSCCLRSWMDAMGDTHRASRVSGAPLDGRVAELLRVRTDLISSDPPVPAKEIDRA